MNRLSPACLTLGATLCAVGCILPGPALAQSIFDGHDGHYCRRYNPTGKLLAHAVSPVLDADPQAFHHPEPWYESGTDGPPRVLSGSCFAVSVVRPFDLKKAEVGDQVAARLMADLKIRGVTLASRGAMVNGHVTNVEREPNEIKAGVSTRRRLHSGAAVGLLFTEVVGGKRQIVPLDAAPAGGSHVLSATGSDVLMVIDKDGNITGSLSPTVKGDPVDVLEIGRAHV